ncbi:hypothetical protein NUW54_g12754 [Trametes sanguinea]|uniref:Uncharacterized protein n=1 Tax=Trametes sanguinea TaxID=158606 RepID=A0ACC1MTK4_9APHY|nr:hypothetical protein NUW54_g12754 [Trametes sanguinea]
MKRTVLFVALSAAVPYVAAHGYLAQVSIDGKAYAGNIPNNYQGGPRTGLSCKACLDCSGRIAFGPITSASTLCLPRAARVRDSVETRIHGHM